MEPAHAAADDTLQDALQWFGAVLQLPLQPPPSQHAAFNNNAARLPFQQHQQHQQQQPHIPHQRTSAHGFSMPQQQPGWAAPQQQQQQQRQSASKPPEPPQQQQQHPAGRPSWTPQPPQQQQQHPAGRPSWPPQPLQQQQQQQPQQQQAGAPASACVQQQHPYHQQQQQQQRASHRSFAQCLSSNSSRMFSQTDTLTAAAHADAQVQPTPTPTAPHGQQQQQHMHQVNERQQPRQSAIKSQWQAQPLQDASSFMPDQQQQQQQQLQQQQQQELWAAQQPPAQWQQHQPNMHPSPLQQQQQQQQQQAAPPPRHRAKKLLQQLSAWGDEGDRGDDDVASASAAGGGGGTAGSKGRWQQQGAAGLAPAAAAQGSKSSSSSTRWPWLGRDRRDARGRPPGDAGYDPSTLHIPAAALEAMTEFARQFWSIKCVAMDLVLFVRHGSFYNLFDLDADVGLRVGLNLSGPPVANMWKVGCSKDHFATWAAKVLALGYSVGRVEEMPAASSSSSRGGGGGSSRLLTRQLVRIYTPGTAVEGLLLDDQDYQSHPLLCLAELPYSSTTQQQQQQPAPGRFYGAAPPAAAAPPASTAHALGICLLDISSGVCRVGCFTTDADPTRSALAVALMTLDPAEAVAVRGNLSGATTSLLKQHYGRKAPAAGPLGCGGGSKDAGLSWLPAATAAAALSNPSGAVLQGALSDAQLQQVQQVAAQAASVAAAAAVEGGSSNGGTQRTSSSSRSSMAAGGASAAAVLAAVAVGLKQLERCSLLADVLPTLELQPLEALTALGAGTVSQPGRPLLLDNNAIAALDLLPLAHTGAGWGASSPSAAGGGGASLKGQHPSSSLFGLLDRTASAAGKRKLRQWICRPLTVASAINERLDVLDTLLALPAAAAGLQERLSRLPDAERLLPKAAAAARALLEQQQQHVLEAQQQQLDGPAGVVMDPAATGQREERQAWQALVALPPCLMGLIEAVAALRRHVASHTNTAKLPLLRRAELAAARAVQPATAVHQLLLNATWSSQAEQAPAAAAATAGRGRGKNGAAAAAAAAAAVAAAGPSSNGLCLAPAADPAYDAAVGESQYLADAYEAELQAQQQWYSRRQISSSNNGWGQQQRVQHQQPQQGGVQVQQVFVVSEAEGVLGLVVSVGAAAQHLAGFGPHSSSSSRGSGPAATAAAANLLADLPAAGHTIIQQEVIQEDSAAKPPTGRAGKAQAAAGSRGKKGAGAAAAAAGCAHRPGCQVLLLHVHVPELQDLQQQLQQAERQVAAAAAAALRQVAETLSGAYGVFRSLVGAVADLDVLAGFSQVVGSAPPGCSFCRPQFASAAPSQHAGPAGSSAASATAPLLQLEGLWHPMLGAVAGSSSSGVVPNDLQLGGADKPGAMLLTGANQGGKSSLCRAVCVAVITAQLGCHVAADKAVLCPVDAIFTRIGAADAIMTGRSTFMVEMTETAACLRAASPSSLIVLDELGRGTSTHDGYALAYAVLRQLACSSSYCDDAGAGAASGARSTLADAGGMQQQQQQGHMVLPRVLFATHYHGLAQEADLQPHIQSQHMSTLWHEASRRLVHCYKLRPGAAPTGSCGIECAALAGVPSSVVQRAAAVAAAMQERCERRDRDGDAATPWVRQLVQM